MSDSRKLSFEERMARMDASWAETCDSMREHLPEYDEQSARYGFRRAWEKRDDMEAAQQAQPLPKCPNCTADTELILHCPNCGINGPKYEQAQPETGKFWPSGLPYDGEQAQPEETNDN